MNLADFFSREAGQQRTKWLNDKAGSIYDVAQHYLGPTGIPQRVIAANEVLNPVVGITDSMVAGGEAMAPGLTPGGRGSAVLRSVTDAAGALAPVAAAKIAKLPADDVVSALAESLTGVTAPAARFGASEVGSVPAPRYYTPDQPEYRGRGQDVAEDFLANRIPEDPGVPGPVGTVQDPNQLAMHLPSPKPSKPMAPRDRDTGILYSEAYQQALNLPQNKGTVNQYRKALEKAGVKPEELEWRGFDTTYGDPNAKLTKDELVEFFKTDSGDVVEPNVYRATGTTGGSAEDVDYLRERWMEDNMQSETDFYLSEFLPDQVANDPESYGAVDLTSFDIDDPDDIERLTEFLDDPDDLETALDFIRENPRGMLTSDASGYSDVYDFTNQHLQGDAEEYARDGLQQQLGEMDDSELRQAMGSKGTGFDAGDTTFSDYMLPGVSDYYENVRTTSLNPDRFAGRKPYDGGHSFEGDTTDQNFWSRGGDVPMMEGGPANTRAVLEIQSDLSQKTVAPGQQNPKARPVRRTAQQELAVAQEAQRKADLQHDLSMNAHDINTALPRSSFMNTDERYLRRGLPHGASGGPRIQQFFTQDEAMNPVTDAVRELNFMLPEGEAAASYTPRRARDAWMPGIERGGQLDHRQSEMLLRNGNLETGEGVQMETGQSLADLMASQGKVADPHTVEMLQHRELGNASQFREGGNSMDLSPTTGYATASPRQNSWPEEYSTLGNLDNARLREAVAESMSPLPPEIDGQPTLPFDYDYRTERLGELGQQRTALREELYGPPDQEPESILDEMMDTGSSPGAPFQQRDVGPVRAALARELAQAVKDDKSALVTGTGEMANRFTYLPESKFYVYDKETPKQLQKLLDKAAPGTKIEPVRVHMGEVPGADHRGYVQMMGVRLTPEVKTAIQKNGIPYFALPGGLVALGSMQGGDQEADPGI